LLLADDLKIKQVLINLLSNAAKFTPSNGQVTMWAELEANGSFTIEVADTGIGIAPEDIPKVFTPFTQLNAHVSRQVQGTGLGLPLAKALVQLHGGTLTIRSEKDKGTAVTVRLPARRVLQNRFARRDRPSSSVLAPDSNSVTEIEAWTD
jgi:signal transduction histidine kinase